MIVDNTSIEISNASGWNVYGVAYEIYSQSNVTITSTRIRLTDIDVTNIYGIAQRIGYSGGSANISVDNTLIKINNASGNYVRGVAYEIYSQSNITITSTNISLTDIGVEWYIYGIA